MVALQMELCEPPAEGRINEPLDRHRLDLPNIARVFPDGAVA
jgi:hypothetical protein